MNIASDSFLAVEDVPDVFELLKEPLLCKRCPVEPARKDRDVNQVGLNRIHLITDENKHK